MGRIVLTKPDRFSILSPFIAYFTLAHVRIYNEVYIKVMLMWLFLLVRDKGASKRN